MCRRARCVNLPLPTPPRYSTPTSDWLSRTALPERESAPTEGEFFPRARARSNFPGRLRRSPWPPCRNLLPPKQKARLDRRAVAHPAGSACKIETLLFERQAERLRKISQAGTLRRLFDPVTPVNQQHERKPAGGEGTRFLGIGLVWVGSTVLFLYLGSLADKWLGTDQVFTLVGAGVGIVAGFYYVYRQVAATNQGGRTTRKTDKKE